MEGLAVGRSLRQGRVRLGCTTLQEFVLVPGQRRATSTLPAVSSHAEAAVRLAECAEWPPSAVCGLAVSTAPRSASGACSLLSPNWALRSVVLVELCSHRKAALDS